jgi:hypothetical protein
MLAEKRAIRGGSQMGQLDLTKGPAKMGICYHVERAVIPSKGSFPFLYNKFMYALNIIICTVCVCV